MKTNVKNKIVYAVLSVVTCIALSFGVIGAYKNASASYAETMNDSYQESATSKSVVTATNGDVSFGERALSKADNPFVLQENGAAGMVLRGESGAQFVFKKEIDLSKLTWTNQDNYDPIIEYTVAPNTGKYVRYNAKSNGAVSEEYTYLAGRELDSMVIYIRDSQNANKGIYITIEPDQIRDNSQSPCSAKYYFKDIATGDPISIIGRSGVENNAGGINNAGGLEYYNTGFSGTAVYASGFTIVNNKFYIGKFHHAGTNHEVISDVSSYFPSNKVTVELIYGNVLSGKPNFYMTASYGANCKIDDDSKWTNNDTYVVISALGGERYDDYIKIKDSYDGVKNKAYLVPNPVAFVDASVVDGATFKYTIKDASNQTVKNEATYSNTDNSFTTDKVGKYKVIYKTTVSEQDLTATYDFEIKETQTISVTPSEEARADGFNTLNKLGDNSYVYNVGATSYSSAYRNNATPPVEVKVEWFNGTAYELENTLTAVKETEKYHFNKLGLYKLTYTAKDPTGNVATAVREFNVNRNYYKFNVSDVEIYDISSNENSFSIDSSLLTIYDTSLGNDCHLTNGTFSVEYKKGNGAYANALTLGNDIFDEVGEYTVKVKYDYEGGVIEKEFAVNVVDNGVPEIFFTGTQTAMGKVQLVEKDGKLEVYNAVLDSTITFSKLLAYDTVAGNLNNISNKITATLSVLVNEEIVYDELLTLNGESYSINLSSLNKGEGEYVFRFYVEDETGNNNYLLVKFIAKNKVGSIQLADVIKDLYDTATGINLTGVKAVDMYGVEDTSITVTTKFFKGGEELKSFTGSNVVYVPDKSGVYEVVITASVNDQVVFEEIRKTFTVEDKKAPVITVKNDINKTGRTGFEITLPEFVSTDANASITMPIVKVTYNDFEINVYNGKFTPMNEGKYVVTVTADDGYGNVAIYSYEIEVGTGVTKKVNFDGLTITLAIVGGVSLIAIVVLLIFIAKKKRKS